MSSIFNVATALLDVPSGKEGIVIEECAAFAFSVTTLVSLALALIGFDCALMGSDCALMAVTQASKTIAMMRRRRGK